MSISVTAVSAALMSPQVIACLQAAGACLLGAQSAVGIASLINFKNQTDFTPDDIETFLNELQKNNIKDLSEEFITKFTSEQLLIKTLKENGDFDVKQKQGIIVCEGYDAKLEFYKKNMDGPYFVKIYTNKGCKFNFEELDGEYNLNAQDVNYNNIIQAIQQEKLNLANEEVTEDNTIILTINLE